MAENKLTPTALPFWSWNDELEETPNDEYWDCWYRAATSGRGLYTVLSGIEDHTYDEIAVYAAYLKKWYEFHDGSQVPACIDEFFDCEMQDEELREYYTLLANKLQTPNECGVAEKSR